MLKASGLRRSYEAAKKDGRIGERRFMADLREALSSKQIQVDDERIDLSIKDLFENFVPNGHELIGCWKRGEDSSSLMEAGDAVSTTMFSNITGQIVYNAVIDAFTSEEFRFTPLVKTVQTEFNGEKIAGIGRMGDRAEVVGEGLPYPKVGVSEDYIETPQTTKRGMIVPLTKEAIAFDRTGLVIQRCGEVGEFLGLNKEKRVIDAIIDENVTTHRYKWRGTSYATYQTSTPWDNSTTSATLTDWTDIDEAFQTLDAILDPNTGEPILNSPKDLVVTRQNLAKARYIMSATEIRVGDGASTTTQTIASNPVGGTLTIHSSQLLAARMGTDTTWYVGDVRKAFAYMQNWPITTVQAPSNTTDEFERDIVMQWKASERGAMATIEPRVMTKCTV
jgi:hypothetical protein